MEAHEKDTPVEITPGDEQKQERGCGCLASYVVATFGIPMAVMVMMAIGVDHPANAEAVLRDVSLGLFGGFVVGVLGSISIIEFGRGIPGATEKIRRWMGFEKDQHL